MICRQSEFSGGQSHDQGVRHRALHCGIQVAARPHLVLTENWVRFIKVWTKFFWIEEQKGRKIGRQRWRISKEEEWAGPHRRRHRGEQGAQYCWGFIFVYIQAYIFKQNEKSNAMVYIQTWNVSTIVHYRFYHTGSKVVNKNKYWFDIFLVLIKVFIYFKIPNNKNSTYVIFCVVKYHDRVTLKASRHGCFSDIKRESIVCQSWKELYSFHTSHLQTVCRPSPGLRT